MGSPRGRLWSAGGWVARVCGRIWRGCRGAARWRWRRAAARTTARLASRLGAVLMSPQFVAPYVKSNKNDVLDADAIAEASSRPAMRFVPVKSAPQEHVQQLHRARQVAVRQRTALGNQIHGFLLEYGIESPRGRGALLARLAEALEDAENELPVEGRALLQELAEELRHQHERVTEFDDRLAGAARQSPACQRLMTIPGVGVLSATALVASAGDASEFRNGREMAAWLGLVPRQHSTGGRAVLLGISKRGDRYLRTLLIHGARSALHRAGRRKDRRSRWAVATQSRRGANVAPVALANKNARTAWALLRRGEERRRASADAGIDGEGRWAGGVNDAPRASATVACQAAARLLRCAATLRVTPDRRRGGGGPWPKAGFRPRPTAHRRIPRGCEGSDETMVDRLDRHVQNLLRRKVGKTASLCEVCVCGNPSGPGRSKCVQRRGRIHACNQSPPQTVSTLAIAGRTIHAP